MMRAPVTAAMLAIATAATIAVSSTPALASCAASPAKAPDAFVGNVVRLGIDDRQAFVREDDGTVVEVDGGTVAENVASGEDFHFRLGGRYEIDPTNAEPPFLVNDCTATTLLTMTTVPPVASALAARTPAALTPTILLNGRTSGRHDAVPIVVCFVVVAALGLFLWRQVVHRSTNKRDADEPGSV
jgi:hypothetical protein